jgi:hypothetical protein
LAKDSTAETGDQCAKNDAPKNSCV